MSRILEDVSEQVALLGLKPGTSEFEFEVKKGLVIKCMESQGVASCTSCPRFTYCDLRLSLWREASLGSEYKYEADE